MGVGWGRGGLDGVSGREQGMAGKGRRLHVRTSPARGCSLGPRQAGRRKALDCREASR